jgi:hypothetical protein
MLGWNRRTASRFELNQPRDRYPGSVRQIAVTDAGQRASSSDQSAGDQKRMSHGLSREQVTDP